MTVTTPEEELAVLSAVAAGLDAQAREAFDELIDLIRQGVPPQEAVKQVLAAFQGDMAATIATALSAVMAESVGSASVLQLRVGTISLSGKLYFEAQQVGQVVQGVVTRHLQGFADARRLALQLFEGYAFRAPDAEPLQINRRNPKLPLYLREALLTSDPVQNELSRAFARIQVKNLSTDGLRAAYSGLLDAISGVEAGKGSLVLEKRLETAFFARVRYFAQRIAQTEIHRAFANRQAEELMADVDVEFVQIRRAPGKQKPCICSLFVGRDQWGLGAGVYPKDRAPLPPFHPFCRCNVAPRLDLTGKKVPKLDEGADLYFLRRLNLDVASQTMGSHAKLQLVANGQTAEAVFNLTQQPAFRLKTVGEVAKVLA